MQGVAPEEWYYSIPVVTRYWMTGIVLVGALITFGFISPALLILDWKAIF